MNILVPDSWLRKYLVTKATSQELKEYLSLCGPSIERIYTDKGEPVYDIEITTNRPDAMSVFGVAREASVILPRFGIKAELLDDPYLLDTKLEKKHVRPTDNKPIHIETDSVLNPRWTSIVLDNVYATDSPEWLQKLLTNAGIRPINTIVDVTNYLMIGFGQPSHAFDYDRIGKKNDIPWMKLRASKKGETLKTLDGKSHTLSGDDIVIEDGTGKLMDLCGIMGGESSSITKDTKTIVLFVQVYEPVHIRKTMMKLSHRTDAGSLFEKGMDTELVMPALLLGIDILQEIAGGKIASPITDIYPKPYKPVTVTCTRAKLTTYLGVSLETKKIKDILVCLGLKPTITDTSIKVVVPSYRRDIEIDVDVIEEVARIYGYHAILPKLPDSAPPAKSSTDQTLAREYDIKIHLRDWGYTETYTYSMLSQKETDLFNISTKKLYTIANPLSVDWVYLRPSLVPSMLAVIKNNQYVASSTLKLFELSMIYQWQDGELPKEVSTLVIGETGDDSFLVVKGIIEALCKTLSIETKNIVPEEKNPWYEHGKQLRIGNYGTIGQVSNTLVRDLGIQKTVTIADLDITHMIEDAKDTRIYISVPKYPSVVEDLSFIVPDKFTIGPLMDALKHADPIIKDVTLLDVHENGRTVHVVYQHEEKNLTSEDITPIREKLVTLAEQSFGVVLRTAVTE